MTFSRQLSRTLLKLDECDHRHIGIKQRLFFFSDYSQGSCFFEPRGARIYNKLIEYLKNQYKKRNYDEVITPNIYNCDLWQISGHWDHYKENMIRFSLGEKEFSLKPMNCPGHCIMFKHQDQRTSEELPVRWADFGVLHRNEFSGALMGLSRLRRFQQDDAHIFCSPEQIENEVQGCLDFASDVYGKFGFSFNVELSLRPKNYLGADEFWNKAEQSLRSALTKSNMSWVEQKFEGAFYGPKIDLIVKDNHKRSQQCATIQLDFQLPERFDLTFINLNGQKQRPVIIHRAILGSVERFIAMMAENCRGRWPFWLSPLQAQIIPVHPSQNSYAEEVCSEFRKLGFWFDCDLRHSVQLNGKVREALLLPYNIIIIVGQKEAETRSVTVRVVSKNDNQEVPTINNLKFPVDKLAGILSDYDRNEIDRADIKLLSDYNSKVI